VVSTNYQMVEFSISVLPKAKICKDQFPSFNFLLVALWEDSINGRRTG